VWSSCIYPLEYDILFNWSTVAFHSPDQTPVSMPIDQVGDTDLTPHYGPCAAWTQLGMPHLRLTSAACFRILSPERQPEQQPIHCRVIRSLTPSVFFLLYLRVFNPAFSQDIPYAEYRTPGRMILEVQKDKVPTGDHALMTIRLLNNGAIWSGFCQG